MPQVASEATTYAIKPSLPNPVRAAQNSERAQDSPFESLLDDGTQATSDQPAQSPPASGNKAAPAVAPDSAQPSVKGSNAAQPGDNANSAAAGILAAIATAASAGKAIGADEANADANTTEQAAVGDDSKLLSDGKPIDGLTPADPAAVLASDPIQTMMPVAAVAPAPGTIAPAAPGAIPQAAPAAVLQATSDGVLQAATAAVQQATPAAKHPAIVATEAPKAKPANLAAAQTDTGKPADDSNSPAKTAFALQGDGKPQPAGDADKQAVPPPHDADTANPHHTAAAETPATIATDAQAAAPKAAADAVPQGLLAPPSHDGSPAPANPATPAAPAAQAAAVPLAGVAIEIAGKALAGKNRFEIRLDPPELGRIEVRLDVSRDGSVTSHLIADRADTLDLLRRDSAGLERALAGCGTENQRQRPAIFPARPEHGSRPRQCPHARRRAARRQ